MSGRLLAVFSGVFASLASVFSKSALSSDVHALDRHVLRTFCTTENNEECFPVFVLLRGAIMCLMLASNGVMLTTFAKAMQQCTSTAEAVSVNSAANFILTALLGWLLFGESLNTVWWCGATLVIVGVVVMWEGQRDQQDTEEHKGKKEE